MILLEVNNRIVEDTIRFRVTNKLSGGKLEPLAVNIADFDGALYRISTPDANDSSDKAKADVNKIIVSISLKFYKELQSHGADELLRNVYGDLLISNEEGYDVSVQVDLNNIPDDWEEKWVTEIGRLKRNCFAAVFQRYFDFQEALENEKDSEGALKRVRLLLDDEGLNIVTIMFSFSGHYPLQR